MSGNIYRRKADELRTMASVAETDSLRSDLLEIANQYDALASHSQSWDVTSAPSSVRGATAMADRHAGGTVVGLLSYELG